MDAKLMSSSKVDECLSSLERSPFKVPSWLGAAVEAINCRNRLLRADVRKGRPNWTYQTYCHRLAHHYYDLASYNYRLFTSEHCVDLSITKACLELCLQHLGEVPDNQASSALRSDAERYSRELSGYSKKGRCNPQFELLKVVLVLEDALSVPEDGHVAGLAIENGCRLALAYSLAGRNDISRRYRITVRRLLSSQLNGEEAAVRRRLRELIRTEVVEHYSSLVDVKKYVEETYERPLDSVEDAYVERKYVKYCLEACRDRIAKHLDSMLQKKDTPAFRAIFDTLGSIATLDDLPQSIKHLDACRLLLEHQRCLLRTDEKDFVHRFRRDCLERAGRFAETARAEIAFVEALLEFLGGALRRDRYVSELRLDDFCNGRLPFGQFVEYVLQLPGEDAAALREAVRPLAGEKHLFMADKFPEILEEYLRPVVVKRVVVDGRVVANVRGKHVAVSALMKELEKLVKKDAEEIRIMNAAVVHIDADLKNDVFHGINVVVVADKAKVWEDVVWDVSGEDSEHMYEEAAPTDNDGNGKDGADGFAGESGGNVLFSVGKVVNPSMLKIVSNGGKGSGGQDGGKGVDGEDGAGIDMDKFESRFQSPIKWATYNLGVIMAAARTVEEEGEVAYSWTKDYDGVYRRVKTSNGGGVIFSYTHEKWNTNFQAYLKYDGSPGKGGGQGGACGFGGQGGYGGVLSLSNTNIRAENAPGENGKDGEGGRNGSAGKDGWDVAYTDYQFWKKRQVYGRDGNSKLDLEYYRKGNKKRIWCAYKEQYAEILARPVRRNAATRYRQNNGRRENRERQHQARATRKKSIANCAAGTEKEVVQEVKDDIEKFQELTLELTKEETEEQRATETRSTYQKRYAGRPKPRPKKLPPPPPSPSPTAKPKKPIVLSGDSLDGWSELKDVVVGRAKLAECAETFEWLKRKLGPEACGDVETALSEKYRFCVLEDVCRTLQTTRRITARSTVRSDEAGDYLVETERFADDYTDEELGALGKYIFEDDREKRDKVYKLVSDRKALESAMEAFVLDVGAEHQCENIRQYHREYKLFSERRTDLMRIFLRELSRKDNAEVLKLWAKRVKDPDSAPDLEDEIAEDRFLDSLYKRSIRQFSWTECCADAVVLAELRDHVLANGFSTRTYRAMLAGAFDVNLRVYAADVDDRLRLIGDENVSSGRCAHVVCDGVGFAPLELDGELVALMEERRRWERIYAGVLSDVHACRSKEELDAYAAKQEYLDLTYEDVAEPASLCDDEAALREIVGRFEGDAEKHVVRQRLESLGTKYIGRQWVLWSLATRFRYEGCHVRPLELYYLVQTILDATIKVPTIDTFAWIIGANPQTTWMGELLLYELENHFRSRIVDKEKWRGYLRKIDGHTVLHFALHFKKASLTVQQVGTTFRLLSEVRFDPAQLEDLGPAEWRYALKGTYWSQRLEPVVAWKATGHPKKAAYYISHLENVNDAVNVEAFVEVLSTVGPVDSERLLDVLHKFYQGKWFFGDDEAGMLLDIASFERWIEGMTMRFADDGRERRIDKLVELVRNNSSTSQNIREALPKIQRCINAAAMVKVKDKFVYCPNIEEMLARIDRAVELKRGFRLRDTQKLAVLALLENKSNTLAQVSTGEGKTLIVVAVSIVWALRGEKVDIVTSSSVLAMRDADANRDIYDLFGVKVSHNCSEDMAKRKEAYSNTVVYGDLSTFQRDYLLDNFYGKNVLGGRGHANVIVDEVDSLLLDKGNNVLYLSHDLGCLKALEAVYVYVWQSIGRPASTLEELVAALDVEAIRRNILFDMYGSVTAEELRSLDRKMTPRAALDLWEHLVKTKVLDDKGRLLVGRFDGLTLSKKFEKYRSRLIYLLKRVAGRDRLISVPNHLKPFVERHLEAWITSALAASAMRPGGDYEIDIDRTGTAADRNPNVTIIDRDTGTDQANMQYDEALHQFLQIKHGCKASLQSLRAVFVSNVTYLKKYRKLCGLTGTLGSERERELLEQLHEFDFVTVPTAMSERFVEHEPTLCVSERGWTEAVCREAEETVRGGRSALVICQTVDAVRTIHAALRRRGNQLVVHTYTRDYEDFEVVRDGRLLGPGEIIVATNLAGRGTDIKISRELESRGGLHVCLSYLPSNCRVERQAFGRAARCGDAGSGRLVVHAGTTSSSLEMLELKEKRDADEHGRITGSKVYYDTRIAAEERCFGKFKDIYESLKRRLKGLNSNVIDVLMAACLDRWAFWLDENGADVGEKRFDVSLQKFLRQMDALRCDALVDWTEGNPVQSVRLAKLLAKSKEYDVAERLLDRVIADEPDFSEAACYCKAYVEGRRGYVEACKTQLKAAARLFEKRNEMCARLQGVVSNMKETKGGSVVQIKAYEEQQEAFYGLYSAFVRSIDDVLGHEVTPQDFVGADVDDDLAEKYYDRFLEEGALQRRTIDWSLAKELEEVVSVSLPLETLKEFLRGLGRIGDERSLLKDFKTKVPLPTRGRYWRALLEVGALYDETKYAVVNWEEAGPEAQEKLAPLERTDVSGDVALYDVENDLRVYRRDAVKRAVGDDGYERLKKKGALHTNKSARCVVARLKTVVFDEYDSVGLDDFVRHDIAADEAKAMLSELVKLKVLEKKDDAYRLLHRSLDDIQLSFSVYENAVVDILQAHFSYRIATMKLIERMEADDDGNFDCVRPELPTKPHKRIIFELMQRNIITPTKVSRVEEEEEAGVIESLGKIIDRFAPGYGWTPSKSKELAATFNRKLRSKQSVLKNFENPDFEWSSLVDDDDGCYGNVEEVHVLALLGLDELIRATERKWTLKTFLRTAGVVALGVVQICIGVAITVYSSGVMTHVGNAFIGEGIGDLMYAAGALWSGYFSWKDYKKHKYRSMAMTAITAGIAAWWSRGAKVSQWGRKYALEGLEKEGTKICDMSGRALINEVGGKRIFVDSLKSCGVKVAQGLAFGVANAAVDDFCADRLRSYCEELTTRILVEVKGAVDVHSVSATLREVYASCGEREARRLIADVTRDHFEKLRSDERAPSIAKGLVFAVLEGLAAAESKVRATSGGNISFSVTGNMDKYAKVLFTFLDYAVYVKDMVMFTRNFLDVIDGKLRKGLQGKTRGQATDFNDEQYRKFKHEIIGQWKEMISSKIGEILNTNFVIPLLKKGVNRLVRYIGSKIKSVYRSYKENRHSEHFNKLKDKYRKDMEAAEGDAVEGRRTKDNLTKEYHQSLMKLLRKTRSPELLSKMILEGIQMESMCTQAVLDVLLGTLKRNGVPIRGLTLVVEGEDGRRNTFRSGDGSTVINVNVKNNHYFTFGQERDVDDGTNNCLIHALTRACPDVLKYTTVDELRTAAADYVRTSPEIGQLMSAGLHRLPIDLGMYGGRMQLKETPEKLKEMFDAGLIRMSQSSISATTSDGIHLADLANDMATNGYKGGPINVVVKHTDDGGYYYVLLDHRRFLALLLLNSSDLLAHLDVYEVDEKFENPDLIKQYGTDKAGEAVEKRMARSKSFDAPPGQFGYYKHQTRIRAFKTRDHKDNPWVCDALKEMGFKLGPRKTSGGGRGL